MSIRERWTVYPLLFMTLGIALTDKISKRTNTDTVICKNLVVTKQTDTGTVVCKALFVTDRQLVPQVIVSSTADGGIIQASGRQSNVLLGHAEKRDGLWYTDVKGNLIAVSPAISVAPLAQPPAEQPEAAPTPQQEPEPKAGDEK